MSVLCHGCQNRQDHASVTVQGVDIIRFKFYPYRWGKILQRFDNRKAVNDISGKTGDGLCENQVNLSALQSSISICIPLRCARRSAADSFIIILAGRVSISELTGLSMREIYGVKFNRHFIPTDAYIKEREKEIVKYDNIWEIIHKGSYPELYDIDRDWQEYYSSYVATYLERDINELVAADGITFTKFLTAVAARTGELLNYSNIAADVGVSEPTIKNWISILERTGIVYLLQPYSASALKRAIKTPKLYFRDTGLACYLTRWLTADTLKCSAVAGNMFETFVVSEILKSYSNEGKDYRFNIFYYRGKDRNASGENEIDLVIEEDGVLYPVEIKMSGNPKASMGATNQVLDKVSDKKRGLGVILCLIDKKT